MLVDKLKQKEAVVLAPMEKFFVSNFWPYTDTDDQEHTLLLMPAPLVTYSNGNNAWEYALRQHWETAQQWQEAVDLWGLPFCRVEPSLSSEYVDEDDRNINNDRLQLLTTDTR